MLEHLKEEIARREEELRNAYYQARDNANRAFRELDDKRQELSRNGLSSSFVDQLRSMADKGLDKIVALHDRYQERQHELNVRKQDDLIKERQQALASDLRAMVPNGDINQLVRDDRLLKDPAIRDKLNEYKAACQERSENLKRSNDPEMRKQADRQESYSKNIDSAFERHEARQEEEFKTWKADREKQLADEKQQKLVDSLESSNKAIEYRRDQLEQAIETNRLEPNQQNADRVKLERSFLDKAVIKRDAIQERIDGRPEKEVQRDQDRKNQQVDNELLREVPYARRHDAQLAKPARIEQYDAQIRSADERKQDFRKVEKQRTERIQHLDRLAQGSQGDDKKAYEMKSKAESMRLEADRRNFTEEHNRDANKRDGGVFAMRNDTEGEELRKQADQLDRDAKKIGDPDQRLQAEAGKPAGQDIKAAEQKAPDRQVESPSLRERMDHIRQKDQVKAEPVANSAVRGEERKSSISQERKDAAQARKDTREQQRQEMPRQQEQQAQSQQQQSAKQQQDDQAAQQEAERRRQAEEARKRQQVSMTLS